VLLLVLWAIVLLSLVAAGVSFALRQDLAIANLGRDRLVAHWAARAGVERAIAALMDDATLTTTDTLLELWADNEPELAGVAVAGGRFSVLRDGYELIPQDWYGAGDEAGKVNINVANREQLLRLPHMTETTAAAILDWRDENEQVEPDGTERGYYGNLPHPYEIRNAAFRTTRELLLVRGVTPELFYGEDFNGNGLLDPEEDDGDASDPPDNGDGRLDRGWYAYVTVATYERNVDALGRKRLNVNTADAQTLSLRTSLESWAAESIVRARNQGQFQHLSDLLRVQRDPNVRRSEGAGAGTFFRDDTDSERPVTKGILVEIIDSLTLQDAEVLPGRININTAPVEVLTTLPGVDRALAERMVRRRESLGGYASIGELLNLNGVEAEVFAQIEDLVTVRSSVFRIYARGESDSELAEATIECIVDRGHDVPRVLYWLESSP